MPAYVIDKTMNALNDVGKPLKGSKLLVLELRTKNVDDMRESPSVELIELLLKKGAEVSFSDPFFKKFPVMRKHNLDVPSIDLSPKTLASFDVVLIATDHDAFDYDLIKSESNLIVDTRGRYEPDKNIIRS